MCRKRAVTTPHQDHKVLLMVLASAIVLWIACLPALTSSILPHLSVVAQRQTCNEAIIRPHKGDRLAPVNFHDRWNAIAEIDKAYGAQSVERIPDGCEPAFSHLVKVGNFSARCVAKVDALTRLAAVG